MTNGPHHLAIDSADAVQSLIPPAGVVPWRVVEFPFEATQTIHRGDGSGAWVLSATTESNVWDVLVYYWPEVLLASLSVPALLLMWRLWRERRLNRAAGERYCRRCNYHLRGIESASCPECGADISGRGTLTAAGTSRGRIWRRRAVLAAALVCAIVLADFWQPLPWLVRQSALNRWFCWPSRPVYDLASHFDLYDGAVSCMQLHDVTFSEPMRMRRMLKRPWWDDLNHFMEAIGDEEYLIQIDREFYRLNLKDNQVRHLTNAIDDASMQFSMTGNGRYLLLMFDDRWEFFDHVLDVRLTQPTGTLPPGETFEELTQTETGELVVVSRASDGAVHHRKWDTSKHALIPSDAERLRAAANQSDGWSDRFEYFYPARHRPQYRWREIEFAGESRYGLFTERGASENRFPLLTVATPPGTFRTLGPLDEALRWIILPLKTDRTVVWDAASERWLEPFAHSPLGVFGNDFPFLTDDGRVLVIVATYPDLTEWSFFDIAEIERRMAELRADPPVEE